MLTSHRLFSILCLTCISTALLAQEEQLETGFEISGALGLSSINQDGSSFHLTDSQEVELSQSDAEWAGWTAQLGMGYRFFLMDEEEDEDAISWLTAVTPQLNLYYLGDHDIDGDAESFGENFGDYTMNVNSTRLMLDAVLTIAAYQEWSLFGLAGIGIAFNNTDLSLSPDDLLSDLDLESNSTTDFAYEVGGGVNYAITDDLAIYLQYLYAGLGNAEISGTASVESECCGTGEFDIDGSDSDIELTNQNIMLGITFAL